MRHEAVNAMLLNEFLKAHRRIEEQDATITELKSALKQQQKNFQSAIAERQGETKALTARLKAQAAQIQRVSDRLEASKPAPQIVANSQ